MEDRRGGVGGEEVELGFSIGPFISGSGTLINTSPQRWEEVTEMNTAASAERRRHRRDKKNSPDRLHLPPHPRHQQAELRLIKRPN